MHCYYVLSPTYEYVDVICDDGTGPTYIERDMLTVCTTTAHRARVLALRAWRRALKRGRRVKWLADAVCDGTHPFTGMHVEPIE